MSKKPESTAPKPKRAILIGLITKGQEVENAKEHLDELAFLVETDGLIPVKQFTQRLEKPDKSTFVGRGKVNELRNFIKENEIDVVVFDDELSPSQQRNLEKELERRILDRTVLILEIFAGRARTAHARTQVELARYQYLLPRLTGMWTHLERQRGGTGTRGGSGEKEIETDRRNIRDRISLLKKDLVDIDKQMATQRKSRGEMIRVALVGYTNVGKSTIMNLLSKSTVFAENKLFATLDTTVRKVVIENLPFLLSDTVGFIRKLPTQLVESFKSTLDEVREADVLLHVVDISHPTFEDHMQTVTNTLHEIGAGDKLVITVFNKIDAYSFVQKEEDDLTPSGKENITLAELKQTWMNKTHGLCVFISATQKTNIDELKKIVYSKVKEMHVKRYPYNNLLY
ncbi:MAG TPA: GTPase HflX [Bacteroidia bacterium]|jgi:GTP-binding protein HflX|nr:GTPase HflX [Bacteroidia bacterium]